MIVNKQRIINEFLKILCKISFSALYYRPFYVQGVQVRVAFLTKRVVEFRKKICYKEGTFLNNHSFDRTNSAFSIQCSTKKGFKVITVSFKQLLTYLHQLVI